MLAGLAQAEYVLRKLGQWQAADACAEARQLLTPKA